MKKKLIASAVSLAMALVMLTSASFAWFTVSTAPSVASIETTMTATKNLEISKGTFASDKKTATAPAEVTAGDATTGETTWGSSITQLKGASVNFPAFVDGTTLKTIAYDATGRVKATTGDGADYSTVAAPTAWAQDSDSKSVYGVYTSAVKTPTADNANATTSKNVATAYAIWLRSNQGLADVKATVDTTGLTVKHGTGNSATDVEWATGKTNADAIGVAVDVGGTVYASGAKFSLTANTPTLVNVIIYVNGNACIAKSVASDINISGLKVNFTSATLTPAS